MTNQHRITPSPALVSEWASEFYGTTIAPGEAAIEIVIQAARWGADQELDACCKWLSSETSDSYLKALRAYRRPKPPSLKEQALAALNVIEDKMLGPTTEEKLIRKALEQLND